MADPITICNAALGHLGDLGKYKRMTSMERTGITHDIHHVVLDFYDEAKIEMHARLDWRRARKVKALTVSADDPTLSGYWTYKYARPPDCLIFRKVIDESWGPTTRTTNEYPWEEVNEEESGKNVEYIYANVADALGWYSILIGEERYLPGMAQLHSLLLAEKIAMSVTGRADVKLSVAAELRQRAENLCLALGAQEAYVEKQEGENAVTDCF